MASPSKTGIRMKREEIHLSESTVDVHNITPSGGSVDFNLPPGGYNILVGIHATALDKPAVIKIFPYADKEQTLVAGENAFLESGSTTAVTLITVEANTATAKGYVYSVLQSGDQYGLAAPNLTLYGAKMTIVTTATTGLINFASVAVEI